MKILITGSEGNIGQYLVRDIKKRYPKAKVIRVAYQKKNFKNQDNDLVYFGDLTNPVLVKKIFSQNKIDYVIHAAGSAYSFANLQEKKFDVVNNDLICLNNVLAHCARIKRFIFISSATIYESVKKPIFLEVPVSQLPLPQSPYGLAKFFGEQLVELYANQYKISYTTWRLFNVVSPLEPHRRAGGHVFVDLYRQIFIEQQPEIKIFGTGRQVRCFTWVEDVSEAISKFLISKKAHNQIFNLANRQATDLISLARVLIKIGQRKNLLPKVYQPIIKTGAKFYGIDSARRIPSLMKAKKYLNWQAKTNTFICFEKFIELKK